MTATTYEPLTVASLDREKWDYELFAQGDGLCMAATGFTDRQFSALPDDHPGVLAWEKVVDEALAEINLQVRNLVYEALERRLPWTWEPK